MEQFVFMLGSKEFGAFSDQCKPEKKFIKTKTTHNFPRIFFESVKLESDFFVFRILDQIVFIQFIKTTCK